MPANLNALIRYKTIDRLLGTGRKYTILELREHCTAALAESKGMDRMVSKRTIQEDIRVLRSDMLGFNAPIENRLGYYYYSIPNYSIFEIRISNLDILKRIYDFLFGIRDEVNDIQLDLLLIEIGGVLPEDWIQRTEGRKAGSRGYDNGEAEIHQHDLEEAENEGYAKATTEDQSIVEEDLESIFKDIPDGEERVIRFRLGSPAKDPSQKDAPGELSETFVFSWRGLLEVLN